MPFTWRQIVFASALGKAAVAGAGLGIALLGALDVTFAVTAQEWWHSVRPDEIINMFALVGGVVGLGARVVSAIL